MLLATEFLAHLSKFRNNSKLIMLGEGELLEHCKNYSEVHKLGVVFSGWQTNIAPYLASANLLLMTSRNEGFGMVIAESGFFGVPTVSTDVGGVREFINDGINGVLVQAEPEDIASAILALSQNPTDLAQLAGEARKTTLEKFTLEAFVNGHKRAYRALVASKI